MDIETVCPLDRFRWFTIISTCRSFMPRDLMNDESVFPERAASLGTMYVEAEDKETVQKIDEITFTRARNVLGVIYNSRSGNTKLKWRSVKGNVGRVSGQVSTNTIVNLFEAGVLDRSFVKRAARGEFGPRKTRE